MKNYIFNHTSQQTAYEIKDYPYGRLRTSMFVWIESEPKKGDRVVRMTINPKNGRKNAPKKSTYSALYVLYINSENGHLESDGGFSIYSKREDVQTFIETIGGDGKLTETQRFNLAELLKIGKPVKRDLIKGLDFKVSFEKDPKYVIEVGGENVNEDAYCEAKITFDRPDGVTPKEIFNAIKSVKPEKLSKLWAGWQSRHYGVVPGFFRVCVRGGVQLGTVKEATYKEFLASDYVTQEA